MSNADLILHLIEQLMAEREKNIKLQKELDNKLVQQQDIKIKVDM